MLVSLFEQIVWPSLLYLPVAYGLYTVFAGTGVGYTLTALPILFWFRAVTHSIYQEIRIASLGGKAHAQRTWTPYNFLFLYKAVWYFKRNRNDELWWKMFAMTSDRARPYTSEVWIAGRRMVLTADEDNIRAILATQFNDYGKGERFQREWNAFLGHSIFTTDGDIWHNSRSLLRPQFIKDRVADLHTFEKHVERLLPRLAGQQDGASVKADDLFYRFTLDAATDFLLGHSVDSLVNGQAAFATAFSDVQRIQATVTRAGPLHWFIGKKDFNDGLKVLNEFVGRYIDRALDLPQDELDKLTKSDEGYTFLHALVGYTRDRNVLRDQIVAVLLAGRDTTAVTLSWLFYQLSRNPRVVQKLRKEIIDTVGLDQRPTYAHLKSMRYLQHALNETLRLYPVVPFNVRESLKDTTLPRGGGSDGTQPIGITKGTPIGYSTLIMQRRPDIYPDASTGFPDYLDFVPERWENWTPKSWTYIPFNGGPRICIGRKFSPCSPAIDSIPEVETDCTTEQFALTEMAYTTVRILQTFDRIESRMTCDIQWKSEIVLQPTPSVDVAFFKSEKS